MGRGRGWLWQERLHEEKIAAEVMVRGVGGGAGGEEVVKGPDLVRLVWACAKLGHDPGAEWMEAVAGGLVKRPRTHLSGAEQAHVEYAYKALRHAPPRWASDDRKTSNGRGRREH